MKLINLDKDTFTTKRLFFFCTELKLVWSKVQTYRDKKIRIKFLLKMLLISYIKIVLSFKI